MADIENQGANTRAKRRRSAGSSALVDISNMGTSLIQQSINYVAKRVASKKRRVSEEVAQTQPVDATASVETTTVANPVAHDTIIDLTVDQPAAPSEPPPEEIIHVDVEEFPLLNVPMPPTRKDYASREEMEMEHFGFVLPPVPPRKLPVCTRASNPALCLDIVDSMYAFHRANEEKYRPRRYFYRQREITPQARTVIMDWILEIHNRYKLNPLTLWMTINIIDRYFERVRIARDCAQLVAVTALFLACKFEEVNTPIVKDCLYLTANAYKVEQVLSCEASILQALNYDFFVPLPYHFLVRYLDRYRASEHLRLLVSFIAERNMYEVHFLDVPHSLFVAASFLAALHIQAHELEMVGPTRSLWTEFLRKETGYTYDQLAPYARLFVETVNTKLDPPPKKRALHSVYNKYEAPEMHYVGELETKYPKFEISPPEH